MTAHYKQLILQSDGIVRAHYDVIKGDVIIVLYDLLKFETGEYNKLCVFMLQSNLFQNDVTEFAEVRKSNMLLLCYPPKPVYKVYFKPKIYQAEFTKKEKVYVVATHHYYFRVGEPSEIVGVKMGRPDEKSKPRLVYEVEYSDGVRDEICVSEIGMNYQLLTFDDVTAKRGG